MGLEALQGNLNIIRSPRNTKRTPPIVFLWLGRKCYAIRVGMHYLTNRFSWRLWAWLAACFVAAPIYGQLFDIAPFARRGPGDDKFVSTTTFSAQYPPEATRTFEKMGDRYILALQWAEERDVQAVELKFASVIAGQDLQLEYWFRNWPYEPPHLPNIEDPVDDPWQGEWRRAKTEVKTDGGLCRLTFQPLAEPENPNANHLPGLTYRRTIKLRFISKTPTPKLEAIHVFTPSSPKTVRVRLELGVAGTAPRVWEGQLEAYNGAIANAQGWQLAAADKVNGAAFKINAPGGAANVAAKGLVFDVLGANPAPSGSHDVTIVTVRAGERTFSFALPDVEKGPVYVPHLGAYATLASDPKSFTPALVKTGGRIREQLAREPEQTYERARREIPALDPVKRQGGRLYLPLTLDASWQKFALAWGGNVFIDKHSMKAKGEELRRCEWADRRLDWLFGTGATPTFRPEAADSTMSILEDYLPVALTTWTNGGIVYREEAFATALAGPLGCAGRDELSPVVLLVKITAQNPSNQPQTSHLWLGIKPGENLQWAGNELLAAEGQLVRARVLSPGKSQTAAASMEAGESQVQGVHLTTELAAGGSDSVMFALPGIPRLNSEQRQQLAGLDYEHERAKVIAFWRAATEPMIRFEVPEKRFTSFSRSMLVHMRLSTTKDAKSGLYMVPAAAYDYQVFANESCFQTMTLDLLGDHQTATDYLETFIQLQGSHPFPGTYTDDQKAVYHGAKVDEERDYTAHTYNLDHGTVLWTLAEHYFMTRDVQWLQRALPGMIRAADWVTTQRRQTQRQEAGQPIPEYGLLPAGSLEDNPDWAHWFAINAYASAGMTRLGEAMQAINHPEAKRIVADAAAYRADLRQAIQRASQNAPVTRLRDNTYAPYVPVQPHQRQRLFGPLRVDYYRRYPNPVLPNYRLSATREVLYGPMILLNLGIFDCAEPIAAWILDDWEDNLTMSSSLGLNVHGWVDDSLWFSRGGMVFQANLQNPVLPYMRRHEIPAAIRNLYNDFVSCHYPEVNAFTEEYRDWHSPSGPFYKVPDEARFVMRLRETLVREEGADLWLTAGTPRRWLAPGETIRFHEMPTLFGPADLELVASDTAITGQVRLPTAHPATNAWLVLRVPENKTLASVEINGVNTAIGGPEQNTVKLPNIAGEKLQIKASLRPR